MAVDNAGRVPGCRTWSHEALPQVKDDQKKVFCGIRAESWIFDLYCTLLLEPEDQAPTQRLTPIPPTTR